MARAIHGATSWGSVSTIRFRISEVDRIMTRTGAFLQRIQSIFSRKRQVKFIPVQLHLCEVPNAPCTWSLQQRMPILYLNRDQLHCSRRSCAWAGNWHRGQGKVRTNTCCYIHHFVSWMRNAGAYCRFSGSSSHPGSMFFPGWGQAGHSTAHSPSFVCLTPKGSCPLPERFVIFKCRHSRAIRINVIYLSYVIIGFGK